MIDLARTLAATRLPALATHIRATVKASRRKTRVLRLVAALLLLWLPMPDASAQPRSSRSAEAVETATVVAGVISSPILIDGKLDEPAWAALQVRSDFRQREPDEGQPPTESTEVRVGYDADALYVGIRAFDDKPDSISTRLSRRDGSSVADWVAVYLDPRHDHLTGAVFTVSASGVQSDASIDNDFQSDATWDAVWQSAVALDDKGWTAEIRIPFSQLRFSAGSSSWGINVRRYIFRKNEDTWLQLIPRGEDRVLASRFGHLEGVGGIQPRSHLELLPYQATRLDSVNAQPGDPFNNGHRATGSLGLDVKWGPTNTLTLDSTINPDFGQVELDPSVINLTEFETSFAEKRQFFLEGAPLFRNFGQIGTGVPNSAYSPFYSRRIGRVPQGRVNGDYVDVPSSTTILEASKLTGKLANGWSVGLLHALTGSETARVFTDGAMVADEKVEPFTSYLVARGLKETTGGGNGFMATVVNRALGDTSLRDQLASSALTLGYDSYRFLGSKRLWILSGQAAFSHISGDAAAIEQQQLSSRRYFQRPDVDYVHLDPNSTGLSGWNLGSVLQRRSGNLRPRAVLFAVSPGFEVNDAGFQKRADQVGFNLSVDWYNYTPGRFLRSRSIAFRKEASWNFGGQKISDSWSTSASVTFPSYWYGSAGYTLDLATLDDHLTRGGPVAAAPRSQAIYASFGADDRKKWWYGGGTGTTWNADGGWNSNVYLSFRADPTTRVRITAGPYFERALVAAQYFDSIADPTAKTTFGNRYVFARLSQRELSVTTRADISLTPTMSLQIYAEPFVGTGRYDHFAEFLKPGTFTFQRYGTGASTLTEDAMRTRTVDPDGAGPADSFDLYDGDYTSKTFRLKSVLRWEWRPGSTIYFAWTQGKDLDDSQARADNVFFVKATLWSSPNLPHRPRR